jgi:hypothetical protein
MLLLRGSSGEVLVAVALVVLHGVDRQPGGELPPSLVGRRRRGDGLLLGRRGLPLDFFSFFDLFR